MCGSINRIREKFYYLDLLRNSTSLFMFTHSYCNARFHSTIIVAIISV